MWTINDFPAYDMLSGWSTHGKLACPICMSSSKAFRLENGGKPPWFDYHRQFLPMDHQFRRNKDAFTKNKSETSMPPTRLHGETIWQTVQHLPKVTENGPFVIKVLDKFTTGPNKIYFGNCHIGRLTYFCTIWMLCI